MGKGASARALRFVLFASLAPSTVACTHDFSVFEPSGVADASSESEGSDGGGTQPGDASGDEASAGPGVDASPSGDGGACGSDCKIEALSCAGTCAQIEQSCAAACASGDAACSSACLTSETACTSQCVTECETCTSGEGCLDSTGCAAAAP